MLVTVELASIHLGIDERYLVNPNTKYGKFYKKGMFDIEGYNSWLTEKEEYNRYIFETVDLAEFILNKLGEDSFYKLIPTLKRQAVKKGILRQKFSKSIASLIREIFEDEWMDDYLSDEISQEGVTKYIPIEERQPLTEAYIMRVYWAEQKTLDEIAKELNVPSSWVQKEIKRLGLGKKERGIRHKSGHKGKVMSKEERQKRQAQPHAKPVVQICPKTYLVINEYSSQGAVERSGFNRENVRKAIKSGGLSKGYLWAFKGYETATIKVVEKRGTLKRKLQAREYIRPTKPQLEKLYITQNKTLGECAEFFKCHKTTIAILAGRYGLKKRTGKLNMEQVKKWYLENGLMAKEIAERTGRTTKTIATYLSRAGVTRCHS
jgi:hypothetical protein